MAKDVHDEFAVVGVGEGDLPLLFVRSRPFTNLIGVPDLGGDPPAALRREPQHGLLVGLAREDAIATGKSSNTPLNPSRSLSL